MKKVIILAVVLAGVVVLRKKWLDSNQRKEIWAQATDHVD
ncbi:DLW-39 family protein [Psychromicrobium xiongbiense]|nr:DLW-39 family protein [Psychromicrobium sp. YIM S02556]